MEQPIYSWEWSFKKVIFQFGPQILQDGDLNKELIFQLFYIWLLFSVKQSYKCFAFLNCIKMLACFQYKLRANLCYLSL